MNPKTVVLFSSVVEALTGVALIATPTLVGQVLLGVELPAPAIAVARVAGFGLLALGIASWPRGNSASAAAIRALFVYNLLAGMFLGYLAGSGAFSGFLLWPAAVVHVILGLVLARPAYESLHTEAG